MTKKKLTVALLLFVVLFTVPAQAQFKNLGKVFEKVVDKAVDQVGKTAKNMATDAALELGANKASDQIIKFMDNNNQVSADNSIYMVRLDSVLGADFNKVEGKSLDIKVYETSEANVVALNNGSIRIYSGLMDILNDDELKALIALQAGHIKTGNVKRNLLKAVSGDNVEDITETQLTKVLSFSGDKIKSIMNEILQLPYTKDQNKNADNYAKKYLKSNGSNDKAYSSLLSKIKKLAQIDLNSSSADAEDEVFLQVTAASSFIKVNSFR